VKVVIVGKIQINFSKISILTRKYNFFLKNKKKKFNFFLLKIKNKIL